MKKPDSEAHQGKFTPNYVMGINTITGAPAWAQLQALWTCEHGEFGNLPDNLAGIAAYVDICFKTGHELDEAVHLHLSSLIMDYIDSACPKFQALEGNKP